MNSPTTYELKTVTMVSSTDGWAVGDGGTILHWNGSAWASVASGTNLELQGVWGSGGVWAVGAQGAILRHF